MIKFFRPPEATLRELRKFGFIMTAALIFLGVAVPLMKQHSLKTWPWVSALFFLTASLVYPIGLKYIYRAWMTLGHYLGFVNTRIILSVFYFVVLTPVGIFLRILGKDPLERKLDHQRLSYRNVKKALSPMERPY